VEGEDQQEQENAKGITQVGGSGKKFTIGQQDKSAYDACDDKKEELAAIVRFQGDKALYDIIPVMIGSCKNAGNADGA
jgi:hypothetical protein